jgi:hypothetical protein
MEQSGSPLEACPGFVKEVAQGKRNTQIGRSTRCEVEIEEGLLGRMVGKLRVESNEAAHRYRLELEN